MRGIVYAPIIRAPENIPEDPKPAMTRPIIIMIEDGAAPHINDPISKIRTATTKVHLMGKMVYSFPKGSWNDAFARRYL